MKLKIEYEGAGQGKDEIRYDDIPAGTVYKTGDRVTLLRLKNNEAAILSFPDDEICISLAKGYKGCPATEILGTLTGIILDSSLMG